MTIDALSESEIEKLWLEEAVRRDAELNSGAARSIPADEVIAAARARTSLGQPRRVTIV
jgi:hypothetical protein